MSARGAPRLEYTRPPQLTRARQRQDPQARYNRRAPPSAANIKRGTDALRQNTLSDRRMDSEYLALPRLISGAALIPMWFGGLRIAGAPPGIAPSEELRLRGKFLRPAPVLSIYRRAAHTAMCEFRPLLPSSLIGMGARKVANYVLIFAKFTRQLGFKRPRAALKSSDLLTLSRPPPTRQVAFAPILRIGSWRAQLGFTQY